MRGAIVIPNHPLLLRELRLLERQTHRGGRETIDHPKRGTDDYANVCCGVAATIKSTDGYDFSGRWLDGIPAKPPEDVKKREARAALTTQTRPFWGMPVVGSG